MVAPMASGKLDVFLVGAGGLWKPGVLSIEPRHPDGQAIKDGSDLTAHKEDRKQICTDLTGSFKVRFSTALSDKRVKAMKVFEHRRWPELGGDDNGKELDEWGVHDISYLLDNYSNFFKGDENTKALKQWKQLKREIQGDPALRNLSFAKLWPRILRQFPEYNLINRLVAICCIIIPVDTSGCERLFSRMNMLMQKTQARMSHETIRNLLVWYEANRVLDPEQWELALRRVVNRWLKADNTKTGKRVFRKDKLKSKGWAVAVEATAADAALKGVDVAYDQLVNSSEFN